MWIAAIALILTPQAALAQTGAPAQDDAPAEQSAPAQAEGERTTERDPLGRAVQDATITARIETTFLLNEHLSAYDIRTRTSEGHVTLSGSVGDEVAKDLAGTLARTIEGVRDVQNDLLVVPAAYGEDETRSWGQRVRDSTTSASVRGQLLYHRELSGLGVGVTTINDVVTLYGRVQTEAQKARIGRLASQTRGVKQVINNLTVRPRDTAPDPVAAVTQQLSDEWRENRIRSAIFLNRHLSVFDLDVEVDDGVCILSGTVDSEPQKQLAEQTAANIIGIDRVMNDIQVTGTVLLEPSEPPRAEGESAP